jgi:tetratricopeptide (TPR) repeat protein
VRRRAHRKALARATAPALAHVVVLVLALASVAMALPAQSPDVWREVDALVDAGRLDAAERRARDGGAPARVAYAEVLVRRGRLAAADSALTLVGDAATGARVAEVIRAELALRRGETREAERRALSLVREYALTGGTWGARDRVAAGRAHLILAAGDAGAVRSALRAFDAATAADSTHLDGALRAADLLLERYNAPDARRGYENVLARRRDHPRALLGLARVMEFEGSGEALATARRAVARDEWLTGGHVAIARMFLESEAFDSAAAAARRALAVDSTALEAWGVLGAVAWTRGDSAALRTARREAARHSARPVAFFVTLAEAAARQRRYAEAARFAAEGVALDSSSVAALGALGTNRLRLGEMAGGRAMIERAFAIDPFHLWHKNTLDLLDRMEGFRSVTLGRFTYVATPRELDVLVPYLAPLLEEAYDQLARRYDHHPPTPIRLELFERHADFSVRTVGLTGLGALGVSFGTLLAMDAPSARERGSFNWGSTAWHELAHTFTLGLSAHRVPRWFSEGVSVLEERRAREGWGATAGPDFLRALRDGSLRPVSTLNEGFVRPRDPGEIGRSYYQASLVCEMIEEEFGAGATAAMLRSWAEGHGTPQVLERVLRVDEAGMDRRFSAWLARRFRGAPPPRAEAGDADAAPLLEAVAKAQQAGNDTALVAALERLVWVWPYDIEGHVRIAEAASRAGLTGKALRERRVVVALGPGDALAARYELARALRDAGDPAAARREVLRVLELAPTYEPAQALLLELRSRPPEGRR